MSESSISSDVGAVGGYRPGSAAKATPLGKREIIMVLAVIFVATAMLAALKVVNPTDRRGDTPFYEQTTENIAYRGKAASSLQANIIAIYDSKVATMRAAEVAAAPLTPPAQPEINVLKWHAYVVLYPIALLVRVFPTEQTLFVLDVLSFTGVVLFAYLILRGRGMPVAGALLFCLLIVSHPAWSYALLSGQFYPDRLFLLAGFGLMYLASVRTAAVWPGLVALAVLCTIIHERGGITGGLFLLAYVALYWRTLTRGERNLRLSLGAAMLLYGVVMLKFVIVNPYYTTFLPKNVAQLEASFQLPNFAHNVGIFLLVNAAFLLLAAFEWRAAVIAALLMIPNVVGNIGGAEKTGWTTHYHTYYLPALIWAAMLGYQNLYRIVSGEPNRVRAFYGMSTVLAVALSSIDPYTGTMRLSNLSAHFAVKFYREVAFWSTPQYFGYYSGVADELNRAVPEGSVVTMPEAAMPYLWRNRTVRFYPIDIDGADYAVLSAARGPGNEVTYGGVVSFLGPAESAKIDAVLVERMKKHGYDFRSAQLFPKLGLAVVKRNH